eukprot:1147533-Pelagomonas_calceolata.AAC.14
MGTCRDGARSERDRVPCKQLQEQRQIRARLSPAWALAETDPDQSVVESCMSVCRESVRLKRNRYSYERLQERRQIKA